METKRDAGIAVLILLSLVLFIWLTWFPMSRGDGQGASAEAVLVVHHRNFVLTTEPLSAPETVSPLQSALLLRRVPVNRADSEVLQTVPGIGPTLAERIVAERQQGGPFTGLEDLVRVPGIGPKRAQLMKNYVLFD